MPVVYGTLLVALGSALLAGCGGGASSGTPGDTTTEATADAALDVPGGPEEANSIVVRVSGTEDVAYRGFIATVGEDQEEREVEGVVETVPTDYEVEVPAVEEVASIVAEVEKTESGRGELTVQIVGDDKVVEEATTRSKLGGASVRWESGEIQIGPGPAEELVVPEIETTVTEESY
jgi:hypothetical protein